MKVKVKVKFTLEQAVKVQRGSGGIALPFFFNLCARWGGGQRHALATLPPRKRPSHIVQEIGWAPGPVWTGAENVAPQTDTVKTVAS